MSHADDEYYGNIQDIEDLIQREMQELNKMQEVVNKKRTTLNDMGVRLEAPTNLDESGLLDVLNSPSPISKPIPTAQVSSFSQGLKSPLAKDISKLNNIGTEGGLAMGQTFSYRFGRPKTPEITIKAQTGGVDFMERNKEQINAIAQKKKLEKEERDKSITKKPVASVKYESIGSKIKETINVKSSKNFDKAQNSPKRPSKPDARAVQHISETHEFEEESNTKSPTRQDRSQNPSRSVSRTKPQQSQPQFVSSKQQPVLSPSNNLKQGPATAKLASGATSNPMSTNPTKPSRSQVSPSPKPASAVSGAIPASGLTQVTQNTTPKTNNQSTREPSQPSKRLVKASPTPMGRNANVTAPTTSNPVDSARSDPATCMPTASASTLIPASSTNKLHGTNTTVPKKPAAASNSYSKPANSSRTFRPETMDLFSKLEEYTRYKENMDLLNRDEEMAAVGGVIIKEEEEESEGNRKASKTPRGDKEVKDGKNKIKAVNVKGVTDPGQRLPSSSGMAEENAGEFLKRKIDGFAKKPENEKGSEQGYSSRILRERSPSVKNGIRTSKNRELDLSPNRSARGDKSYSSRAQNQLAASPADKKTPRSTTPQPQYIAKSIDLKKAAEPRYKREKVDLPAEPSFQPMLSRKSLIIAEKMGYNAESLWSSKTPSKLNAGQGAGSQEHMSNDNARKLASPWMSRVAGGADYQSNQHSPGGPSFQPRICEKSKQIDQYKQRGQGPRHEVLHQLGAEQNMKLQRRMRDKAKEEEEQIKAMSFQPRTGHIEGEGLYKSGVAIADRNEQWAIRKEERIQRLKESQMRAEAEQCSFKPKLASQRGQSRMGDVSYQTEANNMDTQYYSSAFVQDGMKNFFTRLEQARRRKREDIERLENWGRLQSKSQQKNTNNYSALHQTNSVTDFGMHDIAGDDCYQIVTDSYLNRQPAPQWETPGSLSKDPKGRGNHVSVDALRFARDPELPHQQTSNEDTDAATAEHINRQVMILRENLKKIQLHMN